MTHVGKCGRVIMLRRGYQVVGQLSQDAGHHGQVLQVVVGLEQGVALQMEAKLRRNLKNILGRCSAIVTCGKLCSGADTYNNK